MKDTERGGNQDDKDNHAWLQWKNGTGDHKIDGADSKVEELLAGGGSVSGSAESVSGVFIDGSV